MAHIAVLLTLVILGGLVKPLTAAISREDGMAIMRVLVMIISTVVALFFFIKSFVDFVSFFDLLVHASLFSLLFSGFSGRHRYIVTAPSNDGVPFGVWECP